LLNMLLPPDENNPAGQHQNVVGNLNSVLDNLFGFLKRR
jgi:hypothetical protein